MRKQVQKQADYKPIEAARDIGDIGDLVGDVGQSSEFLLQNYKT